MLRVLRLLDPRLLALSYIPLEPGLTIPCIFAQLRLKVDCGFEAAIHVKGYGLVLVRDLPFACDPLEAERLSKPEIGLCSVRLCSVHPIEAMAEGNIFTDHDILVADFVADRALPGGEPRI